jgi:hypothetical protein
MTISEITSVVTALAALIAAFGGIFAAVLAYRARQAARENSAEIIAVNGEVREVGERIDGRLSELLRSSNALARAEGVAAGEQSQRDRAAEKQL